MDSGPTFAEFPDRLTFSLAEIADVLFAVDLAVDHTGPGTPDHLAARRAQRLITTRLWPELGELLEEPDEGEG